jgi:hypothetical protein
MEYDNEYDLQTYLTVFWKYNQVNNNFIPKLLGYAQIINDIDLNQVTYENKTYNEELLKHINNFHTLINKVKGLRNALDCVLSPNNINKINQYELDFLNKVNKLNQVIVESIPSLNNDEYLNSFIKFMYNNTPEGRITYQNKKALEIINQINNAMLLDKKIKTIIYTVPEKKQQIPVESENLSDESHESNSESETDS